MGVAEELGQARGLLASGDLRGLLRHLRGHGEALPLGQVAELGGGAARLAGFEDLARAAAAVAGGGDGSGTADPRVLYAFGYACLERGAGHLAVRPLARALELAPDSAPALSELVAARLRELLAERYTEVAGLRALVAELQAQVADMAARVRQNPENSSKPPSSDGLAEPAPKSLRGKTGRKPGRPKGQRGATMQLSDRPDRVVRHEPPCCADCAAGLAGAPEAGVIRRQVTEIPSVRAEVTGHQMVGRRCGCGAVTWGEAPDGVTAPVQYGPRAAALGACLWHGQFLSRDRARAAMADMFGCAPSASALAAMTRKVAGLISPALDAVLRALLAAEVAHFDETGFRVAGKLAWVHSASSGKFVLVTVHSKRGKDGMDAAGVLPSFAGVACHDAWAPYDCYQGAAGHALCNAHLLRELTAVTETGTAGDVIWARQAIDALLELKKAADAARTAGDEAIDAEILDKHGRWFRDAAAAGTTLNAARRSPLQKSCRKSATRWRPGWPAAPMTICGSPLTCGFCSTIIPMLRLCRCSRAAVVPLLVRAAPSPRSAA